MNVRILEIDGDRRRLSLSLKRVEEGEQPVPRADGAESVHETPNLVLSEEAFPASGAVAVADAEAEAPETEADDEAEEARASPCPSPIEMPEAAAEPLDEPEVGEEPEAEAEVEEQLEAQPELE